MPPLIECDFRRLERLPTKGIGVLLGVRLGSLRYRAAVPEVGHPTPPIEWVAPFAKAKASAPPPIETDSFMELKHGMAWHGMAWHGIA